MFTGIVEELGSIAHIEYLSDAAKLKIQGTVVVIGVKSGDSISVNGVCLTVVDLDADCFTADVMAETLKRSSLNNIEVGTKVNLERAARLDSRLGGHIVQGHVDGVASVLAIEPDAHWTLIRFTLPAVLAKYLVEKGSITVDGVSLTVVAAGPDYFTVSLIPTTLDHTTLGRLTVGDIVNLEVDVIAKYVERLMKDEAK
ncbi:riboflavin synthase subunit alpha [Actinomycetes bacterium]|nr:riboflavin synthase subunit alpha [Actinomycetes bacterium]